MAKWTHSDSDRIYQLYHYLLGCLAVDQKSVQSRNAIGTAKRVGDTDLRKLIPALFSDEAAWEAAVQKNSKASKITTGQVINMLGTLKETLEEDYRLHREPYSRVLNKEDILIALYQLIELTPKERERLALPASDSLTLLKQTLLTLQTNGGLGNYEVVFKAYREAIGLDFSGASAPIESLDQVDRLIEETVELALDYLPDRAEQTIKRKRSPGKAETAIALRKKAQREIRRLLARSGNTQPFLTDSASRHHYVQHYLQPPFVKKLARTVVENERLTDQFPVYIKRITTEACGPLPFADENLGSFKMGSYYPSLLNQALQHIDLQFFPDTINSVPPPSDYELASQSATKTTIEFYLKIPETYTGEVPTTFNRLVSDRADRENHAKRVDFSFSSTGIGGTLSHVIKIINTTLLSDIACLSDFFSIAHDVTSTQTIIRDNVPSPVWAHSLVRLCRNKAVGQALWEFGDDSTSYDSFAFGDPMGHGDFCGFDCSLAQVQSALQARLQAIRNTGINSTQYIKQLCQKTERQLTLEEAWRYSRRYPFSSMAMIGLIHRTIIDDIFNHKQLHKDSAYIYFDAYLSITEVLLDEGAYRAAFKYVDQLSVLDTHVHKGLATAENSTDIGVDRCEIFSGTLITRYLICLAMYYYLYDIGAHEPQLPKSFSLELGRPQLVQTAWETLNLAQKHAEARLKKYIVIGEVSQGIFHPHYELLSRINLIRAKLLIFFPRMVPEDKKTLPTENSYRQQRTDKQQRTEASIHWGRLFLMEKARLYIAANGNSGDYAYYAAIQSCLYLMAASSDNLTLSDLQNKDQIKGDYTLSKVECLEWAKKLRDHALLSYADTGRQCYYAIKEKSGLPGAFDDYGHYRIAKIPAIFEFRENLPPELNEENSRVLALDMSLLAINIKHLPKLTANHPTENIYLFGTGACYLFFARGLYLLCGNTTGEFGAEEEEGDILWEQKLSKALRLLDMAWAIAEDGCNVEKKVGKKPRTITRSFEESSTAEQYTSREIDSVRDLYPRRVSEISDLGKVASAACMVMILHTLPIQERPPILQNIEKIFNMLHSEYKIRDNTKLRALLSKQQRFNGHLETYLTAAKTTLEQYYPTADQPSSDEEIEACRDALIKQLFKALSKES